MYIGIVYLDPPNIYYITHTYIYEKNDITNKRITKE